VKAFLNILLDFGRPYAYPDQKVPVKAVLKRKKTARLDENASVCRFWDAK
jgi:hypothetical protein